MKAVPILIATLVAISTLKAQEPIVISGYYGNSFSFHPYSKETASALFIQEQASISFPDNSGRRLVYFISLTEESAQRIGKQVIGVVFVNTAGIISPINPSFFSKEKPATLEIFPFLKGDIYFCKHYETQDVSNQYMMKSYEELERNITRFLENSAQGDTLKEYSNLVDSRYTPLLIKNLSNDNEIYLRGTKHNTGYKIIKKKFFGIIKKKEYAEWDNTYYYPARMSDFVRDRLREIFRPIDWSFAFPDANAPAAEWQKWLDELLKGNKQEGNK